MNHLCEFGTFHCFLPCLKFRYMRCALVDKQLVQDGFSLFQDGFPVVLYGRSGYILNLIHIDPANSANVLDDLANSTKVLKCSKLPWRR